MKRIARYNEKGIVDSFATVADNYKLAAREKLVAEEKPAEREGFELVGPDYRIEADKVVAVWKEQPIDQTTPERLLARIVALEQARAK